MASTIGRAALACIAGLLVAAAPDAPLKVTLIDVEGGGATLLVTPEGKSVLLDAGWASGPGARPGDRPAPDSSAQRIASAAKRLGVSKIDYLVVTHYHADHVGGVADVLAAMPVGTLVDHGANREPTTTATPGTPAYESSALVLAPRYEALAKGRKRLVIKSGDHLQVGALRIDFVNADAQGMRRSLPGAGGKGVGCPGEAPASSGENPASIGIVATFGKARVLSLADTTADVELTLVCPVNRLGPIDLLIVSHHGSAQSTTAQLLGSTAPRVALLGNGVRKGGDRKVLELLAAASPRPDLWQQHSATRSPELDVAPERIANNEGGGDAGYSLDAWLWRDGRMRVVNARTGGAVDYTAK